jgi:hypothetical protein
VFTARYALSPYIKQIRFVFKWLINYTYLFIYLSIITLNPKSLSLYSCSLRCSTPVIKCSSALGDRMSILDTASDYVKVHAGTETRWAFLFIGFSESLPSGWSSWRVKFSTNVHRQQMLIMHAALYSRPLRPSVGVTFNLRKLFSKV